MQLSDRVAGLKPTPPQSVRAYERLARRRLPRFIYDFVAGAAGDEVTMQENEAAFRERPIYPRTLVDVSQRNTARTVLGDELSLPVILAPTGMQRLVHRAGDLEAAAGAGDAGTVYVASSASAFSVEEIARAASGPLWFQLYLWSDRNVVERLVDRARVAGYTTLVITVDVPLVGVRERDLANGMGVPPQYTLRNLYEGARHPWWVAHLFSGPEITFKNFEGVIPDGNGMALMTYANTKLTNPAQTWSELSWLRQIWPHKLVVKGILTAADATRAADAGADGIIVSNHGGRQLDGVEASIRALPKVIAGSPNHLEILLDGGVRRGVDVLRALALGARAVLIGRPYWWGLAVDGRAGVADVLEILRRELDIALALSGRAGIDELGPDLFAP